jgi:hypothetical protein
VRRMSGRRSASSLQSDACQPRCSRLTGGSNLNLCIDEPIVGAVN